MSLTVSNVSIAVPGSSTSISARQYLSGPEGEAQIESDVAVVAHPYGPLGGSQSDPVVTHLARQLAMRKIKTYTFDFSRPTSFTGTKEREQYLTVVLHVLKSVARAERLFCCGYSYGTLCLPTRSAVVQGIGYELDLRYILISPLLPPVSTLLTLSLSDPYKAVSQVNHLAIWGENDNFTASSRLAKAWQGQGIMIPEADHFWRQTECLSALTQHIDRFIDNATP